MGYKKKVVSNTTTNITKGIVNYLKSEGHSASRVNTQGQWDEGSQSWRRSGSRKGYLDISACIKSPINRIGIFLAIDVKKGNDTLSSDQIEFITEVTEAGGFAWEVSGVDEFIERFNNLILMLKENGI